MHISGKQIAAARALIGWSAAELAEKAGLSRDAIMKIEAGSVTPREGSLADIRNAFAMGGVEFLDNNGVRQKPAGMDVMHGKDGLVRFLDLVYEHLSAHGGEVCVTGVDERQWIEILGDAATTHIERMNRLVQERKDISVLSLCREGTVQPDTDGYTQYRWQPKEIFDTVPFYVFGDYLAIIVFEGDPSPTIFFIHSGVAATAYRHQFRQIWSAAKTLPRRAS